MFAAAGARIDTRAAAPVVVSPTAAARLRLAVVIVIALATTSPLAPWLGVWASPHAAPYALLLAGGLLSGFLAGLLGIGGALVSLPVLYAALPGLGVPLEQVPTTAVATALVAMMPTTLVAACRQHARGALDIATLCRMVAPMASGAMIGALLAAQIGGPVLALMFAAQALWYGSRLLTAGTKAEAPRASLITAVAARAPCWVVAPALAAFCACVGMGGGSLVTPYVQQRFALPFRHAVATASALNLSIALGGSFTFFLAASHSDTGQFSANGPAAILLAAGAVAAVSLGVATAHRLPTAVFRGGVGAINLIAAVSLIVQVLHGA